MIGIDEVSPIAKRRNLMLLSVLVVFWALGADLTSALPVAFPDSIRDVPLFFLFAAFFIAFWRYLVDPRKNTAAFYRTVAGKLDSWFGIRYKREIEDYLEPQSSKIIFEALHRGKKRTITSGATSSLQVISFHLGDAQKRDAESAQPGWVPETVIMRISAPRATIVESGTEKIVRLDNLIHTVLLEDIPEIRRQVRIRFLKLRTAEVISGYEFFDVFAPYIFAAVALVLAALRVIGVLDFA